MPLTYARPELQMVRRDLPEPGSMEFIRAAVLVSYSDTADFIIDVADDPSVRIEAAWLYVAGLGGGALITQGFGETWTVQTQVDSQGDYVKWESDWSLTLRAMDALSAHVVSITHDHVTVIGLRIDGNESGGAWVGVDWLCLMVENCNHVKFIRLWLYEAFTTGFWFHNVIDGELCQARIHDCRWNGVSVATESEKIWVHHCYISECSDVGITVSGTVANPTINVRIEFNIIEKIDNNEGAANSHWGLATEGTSVVRVYFEGNIILECPSYAINTSACGAIHIHIISNQIYLCATVGGAGINAGVNTAHYIVNLNIIVDTGWTSGSSIILSGGLFTCNGNNIFQSHAKTGTVNGIAITGDDGECSGNTIDLQLGTNGILASGALRVAFGPNKILSSGGTVLSFGYFFESNADDNGIVGGQIHNCDTGIYGDDMDDNTFVGIRITACDVPINFNRAGCIRPMIGLCNWEGCVNDINTGLATTPRTTSNIDRLGAWFAGDNPG